MRDRHDKAEDVSEHLLLLLLLHGVECAAVKLELAQQRGEAAGRGVLGRGVCVVPLCCAASAGWDGQSNRRVEIGVGGIGGGGGTGSGGAGAGDDDTVGGSGGVGRVRRGRGGGRRRRRSLRRWSEHEVGVTWVNRKRHTVEDRELRACH